MIIISITGKLEFFEMLENISQNYLKEIKFKECLSVVTSLFLSSRTYYSLLIFLYEFIRSKLLIIKSAFLKIIIYFYKMLLVVFDAEH